MSNPPLVSVVIPVYNQVALLRRCLETLAGQQGVELDVILVDDQSPEDPSAVAREHPWVTLIRLERNSGYAEANNRGLQAARGAYLLFLNSDTELPPDAVSRLVDALERTPEASGVAPLHREPSGVIQRTCYRFPTLGTGFVWDSIVHRRWPEHPAIRQYTMAEWDHQSECWVEHAQTSCLLIRREVYDRIGGMDPKLALFYNDTDFCRRMAQCGFRIRFVPEVSITHHGSASVQTFSQAEARIYADRRRYFSKWFGWSGGLAVRSAIWSRVGYETLAELAHGDVRYAWRKVRQGLRITRAMGDAE